MSDTNIIIYKTSTVCVVCIICNTMYSHTYNLKSITYCKCDILGVLGDDVSINKFIIVKE